MRRLFATALLAAFVTPACGPVDTEAPGGDADPVGPPPMDETLPDCHGTLLVKAYYVICHQDDWRTPEWIEYLLRAEDLDGPAERTDDYRPDPDLPVGRRAELADYQGSGYDRGHLAPAEDFSRNAEAMSDTFFLSNMAPQVAAMNRGAWKGLEDFVRREVRIHGVAKIYAGNLFLDANGRPTEPSRRIGDDRVAVPTHCWKGMLTSDGAGGSAAFGFVMANDEDPGDWRDTQVTVSSIEQIAGLDLFSELDDADEETLEASMPAR